MNETQPAMPTLGAFVFRADSPDELCFLDDPANAAPSVWRGLTARGRAPAAAAAPPPRRPAGKEALSFTKRSTSYRRSVAESLGRRMAAADGA